MEHKPTGAHQYHERVSQSSASAVQVFKSSEAVQHRSTSGIFPPTPTNITTLFYSNPNTHHSTHPTLQIKDLHQQIEEVEEQSSEYMNQAREAEKQAKTAREELAKTKKTCAKDNAYCCYCRSCQSLFLTTSTPH